MSPKSKEKFAKMRSDSRQRILDAALELFATKGYASTSIASIAEKAGISKGLIYNYFESKEDILYQLFDSLFDRVDMGAESKETRSPQEVLEDITRQTIHLIRTGDQYLLFLTSIAAQPALRDILRTFSDKLFSAKLEEFLPLFSALGFENPKIAAFSYAALMDGINLGYMAMGDDYPLDEMEEYVLNIYCKKSIK